MKCKACGHEHTFMNRDFQGFERCPNCGFVDMEEEVFKRVLARAFSPDRYNYDKQAQEVYGVS